MLILPVTFGIGCANLGSSIMTRKLKSRKKHKLIHKTFDLFNQETII